MKHISKALALILSGVLIFSLSACNTAEEPKPQVPTENEILANAFYEKYSQALKDGYSGSYEAWLNEQFFSDEAPPQQPSEEDNIYDLHSAYRSAYDIAVEKGYTHSFDTWLETLFGEGIGQDGSVRYSTEAYAIAKANGFEGTYEQWVGVISQSLSYVFITDYISPNTQEDASSYIQRAVDENPNKTIYFPDGTYLISKPIITPAKPSLSVSFKLSSYAVIKASEAWENKCTEKNTEINGTYSDAMIRLGAANLTGDIYSVGSNYFFEGGIIDGSDIANGIAIEGGGETRITGVSIKHTKIGIHIKHGIDGNINADVTDVNIVGNGDIDSTAILCNGSGNTFANIRMARIQYGMHITADNNTIRDVHPLYTAYNQLTATTYKDSIGFWEEVGGNYYDNAYSDQLAIGFKISGDNSVFDNCFVFWYTDMGKQTGVYCTGEFNSVISNMRVTFNKRTANDGVFFYAQAKGSGQIISPIFNPSKCEPASNSYSDYIQDSEIIR